MTEAQLPHRVIWLDPGLHTGWACLDDGVTFTTGQVHGRLEFATFFDEELVPEAGDFSTGWEAYITGHSSRVVGDPAPAHEAIGVARYLTVKTGGTLLPPVPAASRNVATTAALKAMGWEWRGDHSLSASQHLLAWCLREGHLKERTDAVYAKLLVGLDRLRKATPTE